nr:hypothetical transcript [Hymenolepis microstoma]
MSTSCDAPRVADCRSFVGSSFSSSTSLTSCESGLIVRVSDYVLAQSHEWCWKEKILGRNRTHRLAQIEKPDSVESKLPQFPLKCSCESVKEEELTFKSPHLSTDEEEGEVEEVESGYRNLRGTFEISKLSCEKVQYEMEPEKPDSIESTLPQFPLKCSCESVKEEEPTSNSSQLSTVDAEDAVCATSPPSTRRWWFKGLRIRLRRLFLCYNAIEDD